MPGDVARGSVLRALMEPQGDGGVPAAPRSVAATAGARRGMRAAVGAGIGVAGPGAIRLERPRPR